MHYMVPCLARPPKPEDFGRYKTCDTDVRQWVVGEYLSERFAEPCAAQEEARARILCELGSLKGLALRRKVRQGCFKWARQTQAQRFLLEFGEELLYPEDLQDSDDGSTASDSALSPEAGHAEDIRCKLRMAWHVQLGMHTPSAAFLGHDGTCVSSTQWGKRFKVLKQRQPTRRYRRGRRAWLACDMYGANLYLLMTCMLAVRMLQVMSGQCSPWQWLPGACKTSQSGPKSGHHSPVDFSVCLRRFESGKSMAMEGTVVDARVAAFPIRVAGASAKLDGQQGTQRSATCLGKWQFRCCATCRSSVSCTCHIF